MEQYTDFLGPSWLTPDDAYSPKPDKRGVYPIGSGWVLKTRSPYAYKSFYLYRSGEKSNATEHSDHMWRLDPEKYGRCCEEVWDNKGQYFDERSPEDIERFLQLYFDKEIKLVDIVECCNVSSGNPYWAFYCFIPSLDK